MQGDSRGKANSPAVQGMCCLAGALAPPALAAGVGGWWEVSGEPLITAGRAVSLPVEQRLKDSLQPWASREPRYPSKTGLTIKYQLEQPVVFQQTGFQVTKELKQTQTKIT